MMTTVLTTTRMMTAAAIAADALTRAKRREPVGSRRFLFAHDIDLIGIEFFGSGG